MPIRKEWTEWHLTPRGWEPGSTRRQGAGNDWRPEPADRVVSWVYAEQQRSPEAPPATSCEESWRSKDPALLQTLPALESRFGPCPRRLR